MTGRMGLDGDELLDAEHRQYLRLTDVEDWYEPPVTGKGVTTFVVIWGALIGTLAAAILGGILWAKWSGE